MLRYNKLLAATLGLGLLLATSYWNISIPGLDQFVMELILTVATAFGVYQVPNAD